MSEQAGHAGGDRRAAGRRRVGRVREAQALFQPGGVGQQWGFRFGAGHSFGKAAAHHWQSYALLGRRRKQGETVKVKWVSLIHLIDRRRGCAAPEAGRWAVRAVFEAQRLGQRGWFGEGG